MDLTRTKREGSVTAACLITFQGFQTIARRYLEIVDSPCDVNRLQLPHVNSIFFANRPGPGV
jgi:hypothetical protein